MEISFRAQNLNKDYLSEYEQKIRDYLENDIHVFNLTLDYLPIKPVNDFFDNIKKETNFLKSFIYTPSHGVLKLREELLERYKAKRNLEETEQEIDLIITNGVRESLFITLATILNNNDEVIMFNPVKEHYVDAIKMWGGIPIKMHSYIYDGFTPNLDNLERVITPRTKAIVLNNPNSISGVQYKEKWQENFLEILKKYPEIYIVCDEEDSDLFYFDPKPSYFYEFDDSILERTIILNSYSKNFLASGIRVGYLMASQNFISEAVKVKKILNYSTNSLAQYSLLGLLNEHSDEHLNLVKNNLRASSDILRDQLREANLSECWYQTDSSMYFMLDFSKTPYFKKKYLVDGKGVSESIQLTDYSLEICSDILDELKIALKPGSLFGLDNMARISFVLEPNHFAEILAKLIKFLKS